MSRRLGTEIKDAAICMAVGCTKKALYVNARSRRNGRARGYCSEHKSMAFSVSQKGDDSEFNWFASKGQFD